MKPSERRVQLKDKGIKVLREKCIVGVWSVAFFTGNGWAGLQGTGKHFSKEAAIEEIDRLCNENPDLYAKDE